jgi:N-acetylated-alpha-linked acidic dipeptidase
VPLARPAYQTLALLSRKAESLALEKETDSLSEEVEVYNACLWENSTYINPVSGKAVNTPQFLLNTPSGNITAQYVYVNFGTATDYDDLAQWSIDVRGKIVIRKQGTPADFYALETARDRDVAGMIAYLDPGFDGNFTEANEYRGYPEGPARSPHSVFRRVGFILCAGCPMGRGLLIPYISP